MSFILNLSNIARTHDFERSLATKILFLLIAIGLSAQISLVFWPIGNYATLVYFLFYLPLIILLFICNEIFVNLLKKSDKVLLYSLGILLLWVALTTMWSNSNNSNFELSLKTSKNNILIFFYVMGTAVLTKYKPAYLIASLIVSVFIAGFIASVTVFDQYYLKNYPLTFRLTSFELNGQIKSYNSVSAGIYFGSLTLFAGLLLSTTFFRRSKIAFALLTVSLFACLVTTYLTGTRTALVALGVTFVLFLILNKRWTLAMSVLLVIIAIIIYGLWGTSEYLNYLLTRGGIGSWRPQIWVVGIQTGFENFWFGKGMWHDTSLLAVRGDETRSVPHSHNHYLQMLIWTGIFGLSIYLATYIRALKLSFAKRQNPLALTAFLSLIYFMLVQFFDVFTVFTNPSYYWPCIWISIGIALGLSTKDVVV